MDTALRILALVVGVAGVLYYYRSIIRVMLINRREREPVEWLARAVSVGILRLSSARDASYERVQRHQAWVLPIFILTAVAVWFLLVQFSFSFILWGLGLEKTWPLALSASGSALATLGFKTPATLPGEYLAVFEAAFGLGIIVLLFNFVPTYQGIIQSRERKVGWIYTRTGQHPSCATFIEALKGARRLDDAAMWESWEDWFRGIHETHAIWPILAYVPSVYRGTTWIGASAAVLDATSLLLATLDSDDLDAPRLCRDAGVWSLKLVAAELHSSIPHDAWDRRHVDPRLAAAFDGLYDRLAELGLPMKKNREACREAFIALRAEYEASIRYIARATMMPVDEPWALPRPARHGVAASRD